jgi:SAM-dependent methyltransferase
MTLDGSPAQLDQQLNCADQHRSSDSQAAYYDERYRRVDVDRTVRLIENLDQFFPDAIQTDTSWFGLYQGGFADRLPGRRVLELGCGDGLNALIMAAKGAQVLAVDISKQSAIIIDQAARQLGFGEDRIQAFTGDFRDIPLGSDARFDMIVGKAFLHHLTPDQELAYLKRAARLLHCDGEARFFEPAQNSLWLDRLRWMVPMGRRPSSLSKRAFAAWKQADPHPDRDNSSAAYLRAASEYFGEVRAFPLGGIERFHKLLPQSNFERKFRRWAHRADARMPRSLRHAFARSQLLVYRSPIQIF